MRNKKFDCFLFWQEESGHSLVNENDSQKTRVVNNRISTSYQVNMRQCDTPDKVRCVLQLDDTLPYSTKSLFSTFPPKVCK